MASRRSRTRIRGRPSGFETWGRRSSSAAVPIHKSCSMELHIRLRTDGWGRGMARGLRSAAIVPLVPRGSDQVPEALALSESFDPDTKRAVEVPRRGMEWVRSGAVIGGETRGSEGYRRDA